MTDKGRARRDFYTKQLSRLAGELAAVEADLGSALREVDRLRLEKEAEKILSKIEEIEAKLQELDSEELDQNIRDRTLEKTLQKIDFAQAKKTAGLIKDELSGNGGSVLFLLQKSKKQMGHYCIEEVIDVIMADQSIDGKVEGAYRRCPIDLGSAISECNETEFLVRLASYFNISRSTNSEALSEEIRKIIHNSIHDGTTIFLEIKGLDELLEQEKFIFWFLEEFWKPLIDKVAISSKKYRSKLIVALIANSQVFLDCSSDYFCNDKGFDCYKMLELSLPDWTVDDIYCWLTRFRTSIGMQTKTPVELEKIAKRIHKESEGTPESVCISLRERFL